MHSESAHGNHTTQVPTSMYDMRTPTTLHENTNTVTSPIMASTPSAPPQSVASSLTLQQLRLSPTQQNQFDIPAAHDLPLRRSSAFLHQTSNNSFDLDALTNINNAGHSMTPPLPTHYNARSITPFLPTDNSHSRSNTPFLPTYNNHAARSFTPFLPTTLQTTHSDSYVPSTGRPEDYMRQTKQPAASAYPTFQQRSYANQSNAVSSDTSQGYRNVDEFSIEHGRSTALNSAQTTHSLTLGSTSSSSLQPSTMLSPQQAQHHAVHTHQRKPYMHATHQPQYHMAHAYQPQPYMDGRISSTTAQHQSQQHIAAPDPVTHNVHIQPYATSQQSKKRHASDRSILGSLIAFSPATVSHHISPPVMTEQLHTHQFSVDVNSATNFSLHNKHRNDKANASSTYPGAPRSPGCLDHQAYFISQYNRNRITDSCFRIQVIFKHGTRLIYNKAQVQLHYRETQEDKVENIPALKINIVNITTVPDQNGLQLDCNVPMDSVYQHFGGGNLQAELDYWKQLTSRAKYVLRLQLTFNEVVANRDDDLAMDHDAQLTAKHDDKLPTVMLLCNPMTRCSTKQEVTCASSTAVGEPVAPRDGTGEQLDTLMTSNTTIADMIALLRHLEHTNTSFTDHLNGLCANCKQCHRVVR